MRGMKGKILLLFMMAPLQLFPGDDPFKTVRDRLRDGSGFSSLMASLEVLDDPTLSYEGSRLFFDIEYQRLLGKALIRGEQKEEARRAFQNCLSLTETASGEGETSRTLYYSASAGFLLAGLDGLGAIISRADELNRSLDRALALDPSDGEIVYQKASGLAYPPRLFGGSPEKAIDIISPLLSSEDLEPYVLFDLLTVYSYGLSRLGEYGRAVEEADRALALYPGNEDMIKKRREWNRKVK